ncbi:MAG: tetratricopeptide repeat protein [candidate division Zixibacteria bacterium]|nr:tetratricopeptide repeat protein [candidate division Zixibacteria bacterium]
MSSDRHNNKNQKTDDDRLDFIITEASNASPHAFAGGFSSDQDEDDLAIESSAGSAAAQGKSKEQAPSARPKTELRDSIIGSESIMGSMNSEPPVVKDERNPSKPGTNPNSLQMVTSKLKKLSNDEVKSIESNLYAPNSYLSEDEKLNLLRNIEGGPRPFDNSPIVPTRSHASSEPSNAGNQRQQIQRQKMAERPRGIAYFTKNFIQLVGSPELHDMDELVVNDRHYQLRKKRFSQKTVIVAASSMAALLMFFVGTLFTSDSGSGKGWVTGIALDENRQPRLVGASVNFPDLRIRLVANGEGFFKTDMVPAGSHKVEYIVDGQIVGQDYATVINGEITALTLVHTLGSTAAVPQETRDIASTEFSDPADVASPFDGNMGEQSTQRRPAGQASSNHSQNSAPAEHASLLLDANLEDARLSIDGEVLGSGNLTYARITPGRHKYAVSREGYLTSTGTIELESGKTTRLQAELVAERAQTVATQKPSGDEGHLSSGLEAQKSGNHNLAIAEFTSAIEAKPSFGAAYFARAESNAALQNKSAANDDYIRAAEISAMKKDYNGALTAYSACIKNDNKFVGGYLGRANLFLTRNETIAAVADFESVISLDRHGARAHAGLGEARYSQGNIKRALKHFKDARSLDPNSKEILENLMLAYMADSDFKNLKKTYESFEKLATAEEVSRLRSSRDFAAIVQIIDRDL